MHSLLCRVFDWRSSLNGTLFNDSGTYVDDWRGYLDLSYQHSFKSSWEIDGRLYYDRYFHGGDYVYDYSETDQPVLVINRDLAWGNWWGTELKLSRKLGDKQRLIFGSEYPGNLRQDQQNFDVDPYYSYLDDRRNSKVWGLRIIWSS